MAYQQRILSHQWTIFDTLDAASRGNWDLLLSPPPPDPHQRGFIAGDIILNSTGMTELGLAGAAVPMLWQPGSPPCVRAYLASGNIIKRRFVSIVSATQAAQATSAGGMYAGVALNDALNGQQVYVLLLGCYPVECGASPPAIGQPASNDTQGRAVASISGDQFAGITSSGQMTINGTPHMLVTISGTQRTTPFLLEFLSDPRLVLEADLGVTAPGNFCSDWADQSPNANNAVQLSGPKQWAYINDGSGPNGKAYMRGDASQQRYMEVVPAVLASLQPANLTMFIVARWRGFSSYASMCMLTSTVAWNNGYGFSKVNIIIPAPGRVQYSWLSNYLGPIRVGSPILTYGTWYVFEMWYDGVNLRQNVNGVLSGTVPYAGPITYNALQKMSLGAGKDTVGFGYYFDGDFTTFCIDGTVGALSASQRSLIRQYLGNKYGIPVVP